MNSIMANPQKKKLIYIDEFTERVISVISADKIQKVDY